MGHFRPQRPKTHAAGFRRPWQTTQVNITSASQPAEPSLVPLFHRKTSLPGLWVAFSRPFKLYLSAFFNQRKWLWDTAFHHVILHYKLHVITVKMWPMIPSHMFSSEVQTIVGLRGSPSKLHISVLQCVKPYPHYATCHAYFQLSCLHQSGIFSV